MTDVGEAGQGIDLVYLETVVAKKLLCLADPDIPDIVGHVLSCDLPEYFRE